MEDPVWIVLNVRIRISARKKEPNAPAGEQRNSGPKSESCHGTELRQKIDGIRVIPFIKTLMHASYGCVHVDVKGVEG